MPTATTTVRVTLSTFDFGGGRSLYREIKSALPIGDFDGVGAKDYMPAGSTPLRDATARFIGNLREQRKANPDDVLIGLLLDESGSMGGNTQAVIEGTNDFINGMREVDKVDEKAKGTVLAVIFTDGLENASREIDPQALQQLIAAAESDGFTFIYLGANQDAWSTGQQYGMSGTVSGQMVNYASTPVGTASAMDNIKSRGQHYIGNLVTFKENYSGAKSTTSITEDGEEVDENLGAQGFKPQGFKPEVKPENPYASGVTEALKNARKATGADEKATE